MAALKPGARRQARHATRAARHAFRSAAAWARAPAADLARLEAAWRAWGLLPGGLA